MNQLDLAAIKARADAAVAGPWFDKVTDEGSLIVTLPGYLEGGLYFGDMEETTKEDHANAAFVAHARTDVPALVAEIEALRGSLAKFLPCEVCGAYGEMPPLCAEHWAELYRANKEAAKNG